MAAREDFPRTIAFCPCGNLQTDGLNFTRLEDGRLQCAACGEIGETYIPESALLSDDGIWEAARLLFLSRYPDQSWMLISNKERKYWEGFAINALEAAIKTSKGES